MDGPADTASANGRCAHALIAALGAHARPGEPLPIVLSPGSRSTPLVLAFATFDAARVHVILDERAAAFFALGLAQKSGQPVVVVCTSGSALAHGLPAAMEAYHAGIGLVWLTADRPREAHGIAAAQTTEQRGVFAAHARLVLDLPAPVACASEPAIAERVQRRWALAGAQAALCATGAWPGPVHINAPFREPLGIKASVSTAAPVRLEAVSAALPTPTSIEALVEVVRGATRGVVVAGPARPSGLLPASFDAALAAFLQASGWPLVGEAPCGLPACAPWAVSHWATLLGHRGAASALRPDAVIRLGATPTHRALTQWLSHPTKRHVVLAPASAPPSDAAGAADTYLFGDVAVLCQAAAARVQASATQRDYLAQWRQADANARAAHNAEHKHEPTANVQHAGPFWAALAQAAPKGLSVVLGNSLCARDIDAFAPWPQWPCVPTVFARRGVSGIDGAIAHAAGVAAAPRVATAPRVWAILGDLTFWHDVASLRVASEQKSPLDLIVFDNAGGQIFGELPIAANTQVFDPYFRTPPGHADPLGVAQAMGVTAQAIDTPAALARALRTVAAGPRLLWVRLGEQEMLERRAAAQKVAQRLEALWPSPA